MDLNEHEAGEVVEFILGKLTSMGALDVLAGIDESRRLGIEEPVAQNTLKFEPTITSVLREVGSMRRRPLRNVEILELVLERLHQRLIVVPAIGRSLEQKVGEQVEWRVDTQFVSQERSIDLAASRTDLLPDGSDEIEHGYQLLRKLAPQLMPEKSIDG
jgi:hypothetical protein